MINSKALSLLFISFVLACSLYGQIPLEEEELRIEKKPRPNPIAQPKGPRVARSPRTNGVLFVLTDPPAADVRIKNSRGVVVGQGRSDREGEYRVELRQGTYTVEVTSENHSAFRSPKPVRLTRSEVVRAELEPKTSSMLIGSVEPDANILINGQTPSSLGIKVIPKREENQIALEGVPIGEYRLFIRQPSFADWEREKVPVQARAVSIITPKFKRAIVNVVVKTEPLADVYVDNESRGKADASGKKALEVTPGSHKIEARKIGYDSNAKTQSFAVGSDKEVEIKLTPIVFQRFSDGFTQGLKFWDAPAGWQPSRDGKKGLFVRGPGLGLAKDLANDRSYKYKDFEMVFDISLLNGKGAVWVLRVDDDKKNYYMFQLTGPKASPRNRFHTFICKNGQLKQIGDLGVAEPLNDPNASFTIVINAVGPRIEHKISIHSPGSLKAEAQPLGVDIDPEFAIGGVGFTTKDGEEFVVRFLGVSPK